MSGRFADFAQRTLARLESDGLLKRERVITSPQGVSVTLADDREERRMLNLCANNYLGLANHPDIVAAAAAGLRTHGFGMSSVRFICGTQDLHRALEQRIARYLGKDDAILFAACFDANGGVFETLLEAEDAVISDSLNHASIIDGIRLSKARRYRFANGDMDALETALRQARQDNARFILIATDGVFSMDGYVANLPAICALAERYDAMVMVDECHATGHIGASGRGTPQLHNVSARIDIITGTLGKTLGGAMGGFIAASQPIIDLLRQRARPYLFSNTLAPPVAAGALAAIDIAEAAEDRRARLRHNTRFFRDAMTEAGFTVLAGQTPIVPVMFNDAALAQRMAFALDARGVYVAAFVFPVVPLGAARIRTQLSSEMTEADLTFARDAFVAARDAVGRV